MIRNYKLQDTDRVIHIWLESSILAPESQGTGIGKALLEHVKERHPEIVLNVYAKNEPSILFYEKQGFRLIKKQTEEGTGEEEFVMKWYR